MKHDALTRYVHALKSLLQEKAELEARLADINRVLTNGELTRKEAVPGPKPKQRRAVARKRKRSKNPMSLMAAILKVTAAKPLTKKEILAELDALGYRFTTKNPHNSLNRVLYGKNPKFKRKGGKFSAPK